MPPRQTITPIDAKGPYEASIAAEAAYLTWTPAIIAGDGDYQYEQVLMEGPVIVLVKNGGVGALTVTFNSVACSHNRSNDITAYSVGAGEVAVFEFSPHGWKQTTGYLYCQAENTDISYAAIKKVT